MNETKELSRPGWEDKVSNFGRGIFNKLVHCWLQHLVNSDVYETKSIQITKELVPRITRLFHLPVYLSFKRKFYRRKYYFLVNLDKKNFKKLYLFLAIPPSSLSPWLRGQGNRPWRRNTYNSVQSKNKLKTLCKQYIRQIFCCWGILERNVRKKQIK